MIPLFTFNAMLFKNVTFWISPFDWNMFMRFASEVLFSKVESLIEKVVMRLLSAKIVDESLP